MLLVLVGSHQLDDERIIKLGHDITLPNHTRSLAILNELLLILDFESVGVLGTFLRHKEYLTESAGTQHLVFLQIIKGNICPRYTPNYRFDCLQRQNTNNAILDCSSTVLGAYFGAALRIRIQHIFSEETALFNRLRLATICLNSSEEFNAHEGCCNLDLARPHRKEISIGFGALGIEDMALGVLLVNNQRSQHIRFFECKLPLVGQWNCH
mmetsp:Transcript_25352/g.55386  ORF Transcript_25352/g.55386 Transcript_25352/m.55386 type:complete len:211 (+) Transcript_25352:405-1037(+)